MRKLIYADTSIDWTEERLEKWAQDRLAGEQYTTPYGVVRCPRRWWETEVEYAKTRRE